MARRNEVGTIYYCGLVNARNGFGGYTGARPFYGVDTNGSVVLFSVGDSGAEVANTLRLCAEQGFPSPYR